MSTEENKALTLRLFDEEFNQGNPAVADEIIAADYIDHSALPAPAPGREGFKKRAEMLRAGLDPKITFGNFLAEGDLVSFTWTMNGTHRGVFAGMPPTGKAVTVNGINVERFADGKIVEHWSQFDMVGVLRQIGAIPAPGQPQK
ncbi:MAG TPA: ester cyclase [Anaerolineae bacterium]|nr:ester cyclase [Anaerolineae bacterium]